MRPEALTPSAFVWTPAGICIGWFTGLEVWGRHTTTGGNAKNSMYDLVSVGEAMLRLTPPKYERLRRMRTLDVHLCGSQLNVAGDLARLGLRTAFCTKLPDNYLGLYARDECMSYGVDSSHIQMVEGSRMGVNFVEFGATPRASSVVYDRKGSAASTISPGDFKWAEILKGTKIAYTDGIFPGLSKTTAEAALEFIAAAKKAGCTVAFDVNYREHLWSTEQAKAVLSRIIKDVDILATTQWDSETVFGYTGSYEDIIRRFHDEFGCKIVAITLREVYDVLRGAWNTMVLHDGQIIRGRKFEMDQIDRFGAGDSWLAGFLYGWLQGDIEFAVNFGNAMCAMNHTIHGDVAHVTVDEVKALMHSTEMRDVKR
jgi:2-dehydro-3-deoxygluconokinase